MEAVFPMPSPIATFTFGGQTVAEPLIARPSYQDIGTGKRYVMIPTEELDLMEDNLMGALAELTLLNSRPGDFEPYEKVKQDLGIG